MTLADEAFLIRVTTDEREHKLWVVAMPGEEAIQAVLAAVPEGWAVCLLMRALPKEIEALALKPGEVRELRNA